MAARLEPHRSAVVRVEPLGGGFSVWRGLLTFQHPLSPLAVLFFAALVIRLLGMLFVPLVPEEAYYWMYAQHPSLSYFDHPPMVAWVIGAGCRVFGSTEFGVRFVGAAMAFGASGLLYLFGRLWFSRAAGLLAAAMLHVLPVFYGIGFIATMDSALVFFWTLGLVGVSYALKRNRPWGWYLAALGLGGAMLSKYTGVFIAGGTGLAMLVHRPWRRQFLSPHPYLAGLLGAVVFSPVLLWNHQHDWASFRFQFVDRWDEVRPGFGDAISFLLNQVAVATPLLLAGLFVLLVRIARRRRFLRPRWLITVCFGIPLLLVMAQKSLHHEIHINWTAPAFVSLMPGMAQLLLAHYRLCRRRNLPSRWDHSLRWTVSICSVINIGLMVFLLFIQPHKPLLTALGPWREIAAVVQQQADQVQAATGREPLVVADGKYRLASVIAFYRTPLEHDVRAADFTTSQWYLDGSVGLGYPYWQVAGRWNNAPVVYVVEGRDVRKAQARFDDVSVVYDSGKRYAKRYQVAVCQGQRPPTAASTQPSDPPARLR